MDKSKRNINILISIDDNYVTHAKDLIKSIIMNNNVFLNIYIIYGEELSNNGLVELSKYIEDNNYGKLYPIHFDKDRSLFKMTIDYISVTTYFRLFAPYLLPKEIDRVLYLDCDIICNGNIVDLYDVDFDNKVIVGCRNMLPYRLFDWAIVNNRRLGLVDNYKYINAGVLLMNLELFRNKISLDDLLYFIRDNSERFLFQDQDVINKLFCDDIKLIDNIFNYQINPADWDRNIDNIRLVHYSEREKPWNLDYKNIEKGIFYYKFLVNTGREEEANNLISKQCRNLERRIWEDINI